MPLEGAVDILPFELASKFIRWLDEDGITVILWPLLRGDVTLDTGTTLTVEVDEEDEREELRSREQAATLSAREINVDAWDDLISLVGLLSCEGDGDDEHDLDEGTKITLPTLEWPGVVLKSIVFFAVPGEL